MPSLTEEMTQLARELRTQDNAATQDPLFCVYEKRRVYGVSPDYTDTFTWVSTDGEGVEADAEESARLDRLSREYTGGRETLEDWRRVGYLERDEFVTACLTRKGAQSYIDRNGHNLRQPFVYVRGLYRNEEVLALRRYLLAEFPEPKPSKYAENTCNRHTDCAAANEKAKAQGHYFGADHCHDDCCEDCFGS